MTFRKYKDDFMANLMVMSRTANGVLDLSASATKADSIAAADGIDLGELVQENTEKALRYIYDNRKTQFSSPEELGSFIITVAKTVNTGIVKPEMLFRSGSDSTVFPYAHVADLEKLWSWFTQELYSRMNSDSSAVKTAAFAEYYINCIAHFFSDGCGKISMLISTYILMRSDLELPQYTGRSAYYSHLILKNIATVTDPIDKAAFNAFLRYYHSLFAYVNVGLTFSTDGDKIKLSGCLDASSADHFKTAMTELACDMPGQTIVLNAKALSIITTAGADAIRALSEKAIPFLLDGINQDCYAALYMAGLEKYAAHHMELPVIDVEKCKKLGEGSNGIVYRVDDELIIKVFKKMPDFDTVMKERLLTRSALCAGIPCPISFGLALVDGKIALLFEMLRSTSFAKLVQQDEANIALHMDEYVGLIKQLHSVTGDALAPFPRNILINELKKKAVRVDSVLDSRYGGLITKVLNSIDDPEVLLHGDIQPSNIRFGDAGVGFIDLETLSTGPAIIDIASLRRTLFCNWELNGRNDNSFLGLSANACSKIWDSFIEKYYEGYSEEVKRQKVLIAEIISDIMIIAKAMKHYDEGIELENYKVHIQGLLDRWNSLS